MSSPDLPTPLPPRTEPPEVSADSTSKNVVQVAANLLRLGGGTGDHRLTNLNSRLNELGKAPITQGITPQDAEKLLDKIPELKGCFVTKNKKGELLVLEAGFKVGKGSQEEAAYNKFIELGCMEGAANQQAWNKILGDSCRRVCYEIEKGGVKDPEMMREAIALFQSNSRQADDNLAKTFNKKIRETDIGILTRLEEKHSSFAVPGTAGLMVHQLYAPQCSDRMLQHHHTMQAVHHPEMAKKDRNNQFPAAATIKKAQEGSFVEAAQEGATVHTTRVGSKVYCSKERGFVKAVTKASKDVFKSRPDVAQKHPTDVAGAIEDSISFSPADPTQYPEEGPEIKQAKISDLVTSFFEYFRHEDNQNKDNTRSQSEDTTLYDAKSVGEVASKLPIKEVIHHPDGKLEITVSESFYKIYDSLPDKDKDILKETLKAGINGKSISDTQQAFLDKLGTMNEMSTKALAKSLTGELDIKIGDGDARLDGSVRPEATPAVAGTRSAPGIGKG